MRETDLTIIKVESPSDIMWDTIWLGCDYANYYQSREWSNIWCKYTDGNTKPIPIILYFSDGKKVLLPISKEVHFKGFFNRYITSVPNFRPGGWISLDALDVKHAKLTIDFIRESHSNFRLNLNPLDDLMNSISVPKLPCYDIHIIKLINDFNHLYKNIARKQRGL